MPLGAYENICDIARHRGMVLHPVEQAPPATQQQEGTNKGVPAAADPGACLSRIPYVGLHFTLG